MSDAQHTKTAHLLEQYVNEAHALRAEVAALRAERDRALVDWHNLRAEVERLRDALEDMASGWHYIRTVHGDLPGVGWDRCEQSARAALEPKP